MNLPTYTDYIIAMDYINVTLSNLLYTDKRLQQIKQTQQDDEICVKIAHYTCERCPEKSELNGALLLYFQFKDNSSMQNGLLSKHDRLLIPTCLRLELLDLIHEGHLGIQKCRDRAIQFVWWPGLSKQIKNEKKRTV